MSSSTRGTSPDWSPTPDDVAARTGRGPGYPYAVWSLRAVAFLLDSLFAWVAIAAAAGVVLLGVMVGVQDMVRVTDSDGETHTIGHWNWVGTPIVVVGAIMVVLAIGLSIWNAWVRPGRTGYSIGKAAVGIRLVGEVTGQPLGVPMTVVRYVCHVVDGFPCYIGWFWPLWDAKRQTFADKIVHSVVIRRPKNETD